MSQPPTGDGAAALQLAGGDACACAPVAGGTLVGCTCVMLVCVAVIVCGDNQFDELVIGSKRTLKRQRCALGMLWVSVAVASALSATLCWPSGTGFVWFVALVAVATCLAAVCGCVAMLSDDIMAAILYACALSVPCVIAIWTMAITASVVLVDPSSALDCGSNTLAACDAGTPRRVSFTLKFTDSPLRRGARRTGMLRLALPPRQA